MQVVALIPARGGSKSIPLKNIAMLSGKPLISYSIETAIQCYLIDRVIVSTDSEKIRKVGIDYGAEAPFLRPRDISLDDTTDLPVFQHALEWLARNEDYHPDIVVHLRPTTPLRRPERVDEAIKLLIGSPRADSVRSVSPPLQSPFKMWKEPLEYLEPLLNVDIAEAYNQPRQKLPSVLWQNGYVDVTRTSTILEKRSMTGNKIIPYKMNDKFVIDIDNSLSLKFAEFVFENNEY